MTYTDHITNNSVGPHKLTLGILDVHLDIHVDAGNVVKQTQQPPGT